MDKNQTYQPAFEIHILWSNGEHEKMSIQFQYLEY